MQAAGFQKLKAFSPFVVSSMVLCGTVMLLWPYYQYYIDPDAISYLTLVKDYLSGNNHQAINAFWSPMGCWLTALCVSVTGWELFASAIVINTAGALATLLCGQVLFHRFRKNSLERWCFATSMALFWAYVVYIQSFTDVWQCFFLLLGLLLLLKKNFEQQPLWWVVAGIVGALAYFSKSYSFYFFPLMAVLVSGLKMSYSKQYRFKRHLLLSFTVIMVMLLCAFPWIYLLHEKYSIWTSSSAGSLNLSWWLEGTFHPRKGISILMPPPYKNSLFYFEDPLLAQGRMVHFWDSPALFLKFIFRVAYNSLQWVVSCNRLSAFYFLTWLSCIFVTFFKSKFRIPGNTRILVFVFLLFPLPYWILTFDNGRYLWFTVPLSMITGLVIAESLYGNALIRKIVTVVFFLSFLVQPVLSLKENFKKGAEEYHTAQTLQQLGIKGSFVSNLSYENGKERLHFLAWFGGDPWYCHNLNRYSTEDILQDAKRYHVRYYFYFYEGTGDDYRLAGPDGQYYPELTNGKVPGLKVFYLDF
jgi:hypothetical protein